MTKEVTITMNDEEIKKILAAHFDVDVDDATLDVEQEKPSQFSRCRNTFVLRASKIDYT